MRLIGLLVMTTAILAGVPESSPPVTVCFTRGGNCTEAIVHALNNAKRTILVQAYSFTSAPIAKARLDAHTRGVQVQVILDKSQRTEKYSSADFLANQGVPTMIDAQHAISHNKVMIIDGETVLTGSFNFTKAAQEKNAENVRRISGGEEGNSVAKIAEISCTHPTHPRR
jgi:phosphatidylserine/phosphatidylglycerophosphate/cardiolipin synthase-like enzyme